MSQNILKGDCWDNQCPGDMMDGGMVVLADIPVAASWKFLAAGVIVKNLIVFFFVFCSSVLEYRQVWTAGCLGSNSICSSSSLWHLCRKCSTISSWLWQCLQFEFWLFFPFSSFTQTLTSLTHVAVHFWFSPPTYSFSYRTLARFFTWVGSVHFFWGFLHVFV